VEQRICTFEFFDRYFQFRTPLEPISKSVINDMVIGVNEGSVDSLELTEFFLRSAQENKLAMALARFQLLLRFQNNRARHIVIGAIIKISSQLSWEAEQSNGITGQAAVNLLETCLKEFNEKEVALTSFIMDADLNFLMKAAGQLIFRTKEGIFEGIYDDPLEFAVIAFSRRFTREFFETERNVFVEFPDEYNNILEMWMKTIGDRSKVDIQNYLYMQNRKDERVLPRLISFFYTPQIYLQRSNLLHYSLQKDNWKTQLRESIGRWFDIEKLANDYRVFLNPDHTPLKLAVNEIDMLDALDIVLPESKTGEIKE
jgi:hypothetical protein